jgi:hypothetical protein
MLESKAADGNKEAETRFTPHTSHWGVFSARMCEGQLEVRPHEDDPDPNDIIQNFPAALRHRARIAQPIVRRGWLENGPGPDQRRGRADLAVLVEPMLVVWRALRERIVILHPPGRHRGVVIRRRHTSSSRTMASKRRFVEHHPHHLIPTARYPTAPIDLA